jgi:regulator of extracellular matrix RemA (YlzA/DUF370 family)
LRDEDSFQPKEASSAPTWLHVGSGTWLQISRIIAFINVGSKARPIRRWVSSVEGRCIDVTGGKKTRTAVLMDDGSVFLSSVTAYTLAKYSAKGR